MNAIIKKLGVAPKKPEPENLRYGQPMSFAGKKITAVAHHQVDATKRLSMNLQSNFVNKVAAYGPPSKVRTSKSKAGNSQTRQPAAPVLGPSSIQSKSTKRINHQGTGSMVSSQANGALFASSKKSNRVSQGITYDYRSSERRCDTVS